MNERSAAKWVARVILLTPPLALVALIVYSNYAAIAYSTPKDTSGWLIPAMMGDIAVLVAVIFCLIAFSEQIADFFRWLWRMAEFPTRRGRDLYR